MALTDALNLDPQWVPYDSFASRLALIRVMLGGVNVKKAASLCDINDQSWRNWEAGDSTPRDYEAVTAKIAAATGCDLQWLRAGGDLRSRCSSVSDLADGLDAIAHATPQIFGQRQLALADA